MNKLKHPDHFHLLAAQGWIELGNHLEANEELEKISPELRAYPLVLEMRCEIADPHFEGDLGCDTSFVTPPQLRQPGGNHSTSIHAAQSGSNSLSACAIFYTK